jgi:hypothetical protein
MLVFHTSSHAMSRHHLHIPMTVFVLLGGLQHHLGIKEGGLTPFRHHFAWQKKELVQTDHFLLIYVNW